MATAQQHLDVIDALVPGPLEILQPDADPPVRLVELTRAETGIPLGPEGRQHTIDLGEIGTIIPLVRTRPGGKFQVRIRDCIPDDLSDFSNPVILLKDRVAAFLL